MRKLKTLVIVIILIGISLIVCGISKRFLLDQDLHNVIEYIKNENATYIIYQNHKYNLDKISFFKMTDKNNSPNDNDYLISWNGCRFGYINSYYTDTLDDPILIYEMRLDDVYLREDYDYTQDIFILKGTDTKIKFSNAITDQEADYDAFLRYKDKKKIVMYSEKYPRLRAELFLFSDGDIWCVCGHSLYSCEITDEFVEILIKEGIIVE